MSFLRECWSSDSYMRTLTGPYTEAKIRGGEKLGRQSLNHAWVYSIEGKVRSEKLEERYEDADGKVKREIEIQLTLANLDLTGFSIYIRRIIPAYIRYEREEAIYILRVEFVATLTYDDNPSEEPSRVEMKDILARVQLEYPEDRVLPFNCLYSERDKPSKPVKSSQGNTRDFDLYNTMEPELSPYVGSNFTGMYKQWIEKLKDAMPYISQILARSVGGYQGKLGESDYWIFPLGNNNHATCILVVNESNLVERGCYLINTGNGVHYHKSLRGKYNTAVRFPGIDLDKQTADLISAASKLNSYDYSDAYRANGYIPSKVIQQSSTFTRKVEAGKISNWSSWEVADNTLYVNSQVAGSCSFQCILHAVLIIAIDRNEVELLVDTLEHHRQKFASEGVLNYQFRDTDAFWVLHYINTVYATKHPLPRQEVKLSAEPYQELRRENEVVQTSQYIERLKSSCHDYDTMVQFITDNPLEDNEALHYNLNWVILQRIIPLVKSQKVIRGFAWVTNLTGKGKFKDDVYVLLVHYLNQKSQDPWLVSKKTRDAYLQIVSSKNEWRKAVYHSFYSLYPISRDDYTWIVFWSSLPYTIPKVIREQDKAAWIVLLGEMKPYEEMVRDIGLIDNRLERAAMLSAIGGLKEGGARLHVTMDNFYVDHVNNIMIYKDIIDTITHLNSINVAITEDFTPFYPYRSGASLWANEVVGDNVKLYRLWYDRFTPLSVILPKLRGTGFFLLLSAIASAVISTGDVDKYRKAYPMPRIDKFDNLQQELCLILYHALFGLPLVFITEKAVSAITQHRASSFPSFCLYMITYLIGSDASSKLKSINSPLAEFAKNNPGEITFAGNKVLYHGKPLLEYSGSAYLDSYTRHIEHFTLLTEDGLYLPEHKCEITSRKITVNGISMDIAFAPERFTRWIIPELLMFLVKKGESYILYLPINTAVYLKISDIFSIKDSQLTTKNNSKVLSALFHPSGLFFMDGTFEPDFIFYLTLITISNNWPTTMYILPLFFSYYKTDFTAFGRDMVNTIYDMLSNICYRDSWLSYFLGQKRAGWDDGKYYLTYNPRSELTDVEVNLDFIYLVHDQEDLSELREEYDRVERQLQPYLDSYQPLSKMISDKVFLRLMHRLSLLFRILEATEKKELTSMRDKKSGFYGKIRPWSYILQEIKSCYLISSDQHKLITSLRRNSSFVHQAVMGVGKSSTIIPILAMEQMAANVCIVQPSHLVSQAVLNLATILSFFNPGDVSIGSTPNNKKGTSLSISDDAHIKKIHLQNPELLPYKDSVIILDEFDSMYNPLTSEYNIPEDTVNHPFDEGNFMYEYMSALSGSILEGKELQGLNPALLSKLKRDIELCDKLVYLCNYGFGSGITAVPYKYLNTPDLGSEFSDVDVAAITTLLSIKYGGFRVQHYDALIQSKLILVDLAHLDFELTPEHKMLIITSIIPKHLHFSRRKINMSFLDLIDKNFCGLRYAFSGTLSIDLVVSDQYYFKGMIPWTSNGREQDEVVYDMIKDALFIRRKANEIVEIFKQGGYNCLIDVAASFRGTPNEEVARSLSSHTIYFDPNTDESLVQGKPFSTVVCQKEESKCVYFFDQKHSVGTDVKQPEVMLGLCTVDDTNNLTQVSQAIFRMRKLLVGSHKVVFLYLGGKKGKLIDILNSKEKEDRESKLRPQSLQILNVNRRATAGYSLKSYETVNYYEPINGKFMDWANKIYSVEIKNTGVKLYGVNAVSSQREAKKATEIAQHYTGCNFKLCQSNSADGPEIVDNYLSFLGCPILRGVFVSKVIAENKWDKSKNFLVFDHLEIVVILTYKEFLFMELEALPAQSNLGCLAKFMFCQDLSLDELWKAYLAYKVSDKVRVRSIAEFMGKLIPMPNTWLKYYMFDLKSFRDANVLKDLSKEQIENIRAEIIPL